MSFAKLPAINTNNRPFRTLAEGKVKPAKTALRGVVWSGSADLIWRGFAVCVQKTRREARSRLSKKPTGRRCGGCNPPLSIQSGDMCVRMAEKMPLKKAAF